MWCRWEDNSKKKSHAGRPPLGFRRNYGSPSARNTMATQCSLDDKNHQFSVSELFDWARFCRADECELESIIDAGRTSFHFFFILSSFGLALTFRLPLYRARAPSFRLYGQQNPFMKRLQCANGCNAQPISIGCINKIHRKDDALALNEEKCSHGQNER